jgi:hypothetical protein
MKTVNAKRAADFENEMREQTRVDRARAHNKQVALDLAAAGIPVFVANPENKASLVKAFNRRDTDIPSEEAETLRREFYDKHKFNPLHIGATTDRPTVRRMFREKPDALPAISTGPAGLLVVDNDVKERNGISRNGVELFDAFCEQHGGLPEGVIAVESQGKGRHLYFANEGDHGCSAGRLKADCETDVKAIGGFVIAPSAIRIHDGRRYGDRSNLDALIAAFKGGRLPPIPEFVRKAIGDKSAANSSVSEKDVQALADDLRQTGLPDGAALLDPVLDGVDWGKLVSRYDGLRQAIDDGDRSDTRYHLARALKRERPGTTSAEFAAIVLERPDECGAFVEDDKPTQGEFNWRNLARDFSRAEAVPGSDGSAFDVVEDDDAPEMDEAKGERAKDHVNLVDLLAEPETYTQWVVKHFIAFNTTIIAAGLWGSGKTAVYLDIALHIAHGLPWRGRKVEKGVVLYLALENPHDVQSRIRAWCRRNDGVRFEESFVLYRGNCSLFDAQNKSTKDERRIIKLANSTAERLNVPVAMIVIDTVSQAILPGSDREHGSLFVKSMQRIADATGANVTALHHPTKAGDQVRGDGAFQGNTDGVVLLSRDVRTGLGTIQASPQKFRVGDPRKAKFGYRLEPVSVGEDADGEDREIIVAVEAATPSSWDVEEPNDAQDVPPPPDTPSERHSAILRVIRERVDAIASNTDDRSDEIELPARDVMMLWNVDRKRSGLSEISDPAICSRLLAKLVDSESLVRVGTNRRSAAYKLPPE